MHRKLCVHAQFSVHLRAGSIDSITHNFTNDHLFAKHKLYKRLGVGYKTIHCQIPDQRASMFVV